jgi:hypothetical protein
MGLASRDARTTYKLSKKTRKLKRHSERSRGIPAFRSKRRKSQLPSNFVIRSEAEWDLHLLAFASEVAPGFSPHN